MRYKPIVGTLGYILSPDKIRVLLIHRTAKQEDDHHGKYNGLGGKMLPNEDVLTCMQREIYEEAGIVCLDTELRGTINWTGFGPKKEDWLGFIFRINHYTGVPFSTNSEGSLVWIEIDKIDTLPMWEGDRKFLPMVFDDNPRMFHGYMPYEGEKLLDWTFVR